MGMEKKDWRATTWERVEREVETTRDTDGDGTDEGSTREERICDDKCVTISTTICK